VGELLPYGKKDYEQVLNGYLARLLRYARNDAYKQLD
jgi:hypothetical protein